MSFKDVRDVTEHLMLLGYAGNFNLQVLNSTVGNLSNFIAITEILQWLASQMEPGAILPGGHKAEADRIAIVRAAVEFFLTKSGIKLNPRNLYASSMAAAKELNKITSILMKAPQVVEEETAEENFRNTEQIDIGEQLETLRRARELSSELTRSAAGLSDLLSIESRNKHTRTVQSVRQMEVSTTERALKNAIAAGRLELTRTSGELETARTQLTSIKMRLERKKGEFLRATQRLEALHKIRPAHLEELEVFENELKPLFQQYLIRVQCRDALRAQLNARTISTSSPLSSPMVTKPLESSSMNYLPDGLLDDDEDDENLDNNHDDEENLPLAVNATIASAENEDDRGATTRDIPRIRPTTGRFKMRGSAVAPTNAPTVIGSMLGNGDDDDDAAEALDSSLGSGETESELEMRARNYYLPSDDDISLSNITKNTALMPKRLAASKHQVEQSDEDF